MGNIGERILNSYDFSDTMESIKEELSADRIVVRVPVNEESEIFKTLYDSKENDKVFGEKRDIVASYFISSDNPLLINEFKDDIFQSSDIVSDNTSNLLVVPLRFFGKNIAVMFVVYEDKERSDNKTNISIIKENLPLFSLLIAYRIKELELAESVFIDKLTNLPSPTYFWQRVDEEYRRAKRYSRMFSILLVDIDNLREINEKYGHRTADKLLRKFAEFLKSHFRSTDIVTRFGGDEFAIILPETGAQSVYQVAEGLRLRVMTTPFEIEFGPTLNITVTIAAINYPAVPLDPDALVEKLLAGLAEGKSEGGNRTVLKNY